MQTTKIKTMCGELLTNTDIKAICKHRGFNVKQTTSRDLFESYFYSEIGIANVVATLTHEEKAFLYLMSQNSEGQAEVEVSYFSILYDQNVKKSYSLTYTQKFNPTYKAIQNNLIRKGLLIISEGESWRAKSKLERLRFTLHELLARHLPAPFTEIHRFDAQGQVNDKVIRDKLSEAVNLKDHEIGTDSIHIEHHRLQMGKVLFSVTPLRQWQGNLWKKQQGSGEKTNTNHDYSTKGTLGNIINSALSLLQSDEWITPEALKPLLFFACYPKTGLGAAQFCHAGFKLGCLARLEVNGKAYYRSADLFNESELDPQKFITFNKNSNFTIDLATVPYRDLQTLARFCRFSIENGQLNATHDFIELAQLKDDLLQGRLIKWLGQQSAILNKALQTIQEKQGKIILHTRLLIAKINDIKLKAQISKEFKDERQVLFLANDYIAFPRELAIPLERVIRKSGYAIKKAGKL